MTSGGERRKHARAEQAAGTVSRHAQRRIDTRVVEIMARRDAAERRDPPGPTTRQRPHVTSA